MLDDKDKASISFRVLLILSLILITGQVIDGAAAPPTDKEVLLKLKLFLQGNNPITQGNYAKWNQTDPSHCSWPGIACDGDERVTGVNLRDSSISGGIFPNFSQLTELTHLDLSQNTINGPVPTELNQCSGLRYLNLSHNLIDGELNFTGLTNLQTLDVTLNRFHGGIRSNFPALCSNLVTLNLSMNSFSGEITGCFDGCPELKYLDLSSNWFVGEIWQGFSSLQEFSVSENNLTGEIIPSTFPWGCSLQVLDLSSNSLQALFPDSISNCTKLTSLNLSGNRFTGAVPASIGSLPELEYLYLGNNSFHRDIPEELLNCSKLVFLDLSKNNFTGEVQEIFGKFTTVKFLLLHSNSYTGGIQSSGILNLTSIERLDLSYNFFSGELPVGVAEMRYLNFLILAYNNFSGSIPAEYGTIAGLQAMDLSFNRLTGEIPPAIGKLTSLLWLMLANNQLTGVIPPEMGNCSSLMWLNLANNRLSGSIPPEMMGIGRNPEPTFEVNRKNVGVPSGPGDCLAMKRWLPATYPPFSFVYTLLTRKTCRENWDRLLKGFGLYPICKNSSSPMQTLAISGYVQLSGNQLSGEVPPEIGTMKNVSLLHLDANRLSGRLPPEIGQLGLVVLNASNNNFSGGIPPELGQIRCLEYLDLTRNNLSGEFQESLNRLTGLDKLNLSYNPLLSGVIPTSGQLATFENDSFLGDPLVSFSTSFSPPARRASGQRKRSPRIVAFWVFLAFTITFVVSGAVYLTVYYGARLRVDPEPDPDLKPCCSSPSLEEEVRVFRLGKTAFTYMDIVASTGGFSDEMVIGRGGYGVVYRGLLPDGRRVAVKKLLKGGGEEGEREFRAEMEVLAGRAPHPNLVPLFGWCLSGSEKILVYEYMEGGSLEDMVEDWGRFGWERRVAAAAEVAEALVFLHHECRPAVVHRDVKASNVLLDGRGRARVTDFGLARKVGLGESHVSTVVAGTVGYVAPEYGHTWRATTKGDVYSFGVLVMELATGRRAVDGGEECLVDWVRRVAREGWRGLRGAVVPVMMPAVRREKEVAVEGLQGMCGLLRIGMQCTAESPQARPDMTEVLAALVKISGVGSKGDGSDDSWVGSDGSWHGSGDGGCWSSSGGDAGSWGSGGDAGRDSFI